MLQHQSIYENISQFTNGTNGATKSKLGTVIYENIDDLSLKIAKKVQMEKSASQEQPTYENYSQFILHHQLHSYSTPCTPKSTTHNMNHHSTRSQAPPIPSTNPVNHKVAKVMLASSSSSSGSSTTSSSPPSTATTTNSLSLIQQSMLPSTLKPQEEISVYQNNHTHEKEDAKVQVFFCGTIMVIYIREGMRFDQFSETIRQLCQFSPQQPLTLKWVDEEGDPCTIIYQIELDDALRIYYLNNESE